MVVNLFQANAFYILVFINQFIRTLNQIISDNEKAHMIRKY